MSQIRAAFDIGSSHHKLTVARIDTTANYNSNNILKRRQQLSILHSSSIRVPLADSLQQGNGKSYLPVSVLSQSRRALSDLRQVAESLGASSLTMSCIATAVFRYASNGVTYLRSLDMPVTILSATDEGRLSYETVEYFKQQGQKEEQKEDVGDMIVWDSGGGSTQWTTSEYEVFGLSIGSGLVRKMYNDRFGQSISLLHGWIEREINECQSEQEYNKLKMLCKSKANRIVAIGNDSSMFAIVCTFCTAKSFVLNDVYRTVQFYYHSGSHEDRTMIVPKLVLLYTLMKVYGIEHVEWTKANGSCVGLLLSEDQRFWPWLNDTNSHAKQLEVSTSLANTTAATCGVDEHVLVGTIM